MSPLDDTDLDRIKDKVRLVVSEELERHMDRHMKEHHDPIVHKVDEIRESVWKWAGGIAVLTFLTGVMATVLVR